MNTSNIKNALLHTDPTKDYVSTNYNYYGELFVQQLPTWRLWTGRMMLASDPLVGFSINIRNAALMPADVLIKAKDKRVEEWLRRQWDTLWGRFRNKIVNAKKFGYTPLQLSCKEKDGLIEIKGVKDFAPEDCRALQQGSELCGFRVKDQKVFFPQAVWLTFGAQYGGAYGHPCLRKSYPSWYEKWMDRGAKRLLQLRMIKDAYIGDIFWYPPDMNVTLPDGKVLPWRDIMREMAERRMSGSAMTLPMLVDDKGNKLTEYTPPSDIGTGSQIFDWVQHCDEGILQGADVPVEVVQAQSTGSGYSGRSIPFLVLLSVCTNELIEIIECLDTQAFRRLACLNFGGDPDYTIQAVSLVDSFSKDTAGSALGGGAMGGGVGSPMSFSPQQFGESNDRAHVRTDGSVSPSMSEYSQHSEETVLYHGTKSKEHAEDIVRNGFKQVETHSSGYPGILGVGHYLTTDVNHAKLYGNNVVESTVQPGLKLYREPITNLYKRETNYGDPHKITEYLKSQGYHGVEAPGQTVIFDSSHIKPIRNSQFKEGAAYDYSCCYLSLPEDHKKAIIALGNLIPKEDLYGTDYGNDSKYGVENDPHITLLYGLHTEDYKEVEEVLSPCSPVAVETSDLSVFEQDEYDVLKLEVKGSDLYVLNNTLKQLEHTNSYPHYIPHVTVAYIVKGRGKDLAIKLQGYRSSFICDTVTFSSKNGEKTPIYLRGSFQYSESDSGTEIVYPTVTSLGVTVHRNPSFNDVKRLLHKHTELRGVKQGGNTWFWNAYDMEHHHGTKALGLDRSHPDHKEYDFHKSDLTENGLLHGELKELYPKAFSSQYGENQLKFKYEGSSATLTDNSNHYVLSNVFTPIQNRGKGHASSVIRKALEYADKMKKPVRLSSLAIDEGMSFDGLQRLYKRHGFVPTEENPSNMIRTIPSQHSEEQHIVGEYDPHVSKHFHDGHESTFLKSLSRHEAKVLHNYKGEDPYAPGAAIAHNDMSREGKLSGEHLEANKHLHSAFDKAPRIKHDTLLYRGVSEPEHATPLHSHPISTSVYKHVAEDFSTMTGGSGHLMHIHVKAGHPAIPASHFHRDSSIADEGEIVLHPKTILTRIPKAPWHRSGESHWSASMPGTQHSEGGIPSNGVTFQFEEQSLEQLTTDVNKSIRESIQKLTQFEDKEVDLQTLAGLIEYELGLLQPKVAESLYTAGYTASLIGESEVIQSLPKEGYFNPPAKPPTSSAASSSASGGPVVRFPALEHAIDVLDNSPVTTGRNYKETAQKVRDGAFAITADINHKLVDEIRQELSESLRSGTAQKQFIQNVQQIVSNKLEPAHVETIFRTNIMSAMSEARHDALKNELVSTAFPYCSYHATRDGRVRQEHMDLEKLGLDGTNFYRTDDPVFQEFRPPWDYNCRCTWYMRTVKQAAAAGVKEAIDWMERAVKMATELGGRAEQYLSQTQPASKQFVQHPEFKCSPEFRKKAL